MKTENYSNLKSWIASEGYMKKRQEISREINNPAYMVKIDKRVFEKTNEERDKVKSGKMSFKASLLHNKVALKELQDTTLKQMFSSYTPNWGSVLVKISKI